jgi:hypothetical protein
MENLIIIISENFPVAKGYFWFGYTDKKRLQFYFSIDLTGESKLDYRVLGIGMFASKIQGTLHGIVRRR